MSRRRWREKNLCASPGEGNSPHESVCMVGYAACLVRADDIIDQPFSCFDMTLKLAIAQLNFVVGDLTGNAQKIVDAARSAYAQGARLLLTPELSICGYAAEDMFLRPAFVSACGDAVMRVAFSVPMPSASCRTTRCSTNAAISRPVTASAYSRRAGCRLAC